MSSRNAGLSGGRFSSSRAGYVMSAWICWMRVLQVQHFFLIFGEKPEGDGAGILVGVFCGLGVAIIL